MRTQILHLITRVTATSAIISRFCAKGLPDDLPELRGQSSECSSDPMIILDTNMRSALMKGARCCRRRLAGSQPAESNWITSITLFEAHLGIQLPT
jgi:hypothetical protein